jgi:3-methylfumaryl-CoA hydratase
MKDAGIKYSAWIGRHEESCDTVGAGPLHRLSATLDRDEPQPQRGDPLPPLGHWLLFLPDARLSEVGPDGHPRRGGFLPPVQTLPRRMWAGSRISFLGVIRVGDTVTRRSTVQTVNQKERTNGPLVFVTVRHEIGRPGEAAAIIDEHDIVYRGTDAPAAKPAPPQTAPGEWRRTLIPDAVMLFRYSALTFNSHRIHYDRDYVTRQEGYPGLVVHGPLVATLLLDLVRRNAPEARIEAFSFRAISPLFDGAEMSVNASPPGTDGIVKLWAANADGGVAMTGEARLTAS